MSGTVGPRLSTIPPTYFLDDFPVVEGGAYSFRKLSSTYTGGCIRVRRSHDNAEQVIGFVNDVLDIATMEDFVTDSGAQPTSDGYVTRWYEQSGVYIGGAYPTQCSGVGLSELCGGDMGNNTASSQPRIVLNGTTYTHNGFPQMRDWNKNYLGTVGTAGLGNGWWQPWGSGAGTYDLTILSTNFHATGLTGLGAFGGTVVSNAQWQSFLCMGTTISLGETSGSWTNVCDGTTVVSLDNIHLLSSVWVRPPGTTYFNLDGTQECDDVIVTANYINGFAMNWAKSSLQPPGMELIWYLEEKSAVDLAAMESSIMNYYTIP